MSEKRFTFVDNIFKYFETGIKDNQSAYEQLNGESVVDLLNNLSEENEQLRKVCSCLKKENQSLIENIFDIYEKVKWVVR